MSNDVSRRVALCGLGATGALVASGCGGSTSQVPESAVGKKLAATGEIPVGGGTIFARQNVVVTQPSAGRFRAFNSTCTHQGCRLGQVSDGVIICPCHGSRFNIADGSVAVGPATQPLAPVGIKVEGDSIVITSS